MMRPSPSVINVVGTGSALRGVVICFYMSNEGLSILENASYLGLPVPEKLNDSYEEFMDEYIAFMENTMQILAV